MTKKEDMNTKPKKALKILPGKTNSPMVAVVGNSGSGKTTLIEKLIPEITKRGLRVGTIKHDVHGFEMDKPGKDSWRHKHAGAAMTVISSPYQIGMVKDADHDHEPGELLRLFGDVDVILCEGFKNRNIPKMEIFRAEMTIEPLCKNDEQLLALISDSDMDIGVPRFATNDVSSIAEFLMVHFNLVPATGSGHRQTA